MIMITGGAFQGKRSFAVQRFGIDISEILDGGSCGLSEIPEARCVANYEQTVKRLISAGIDVTAFTEKLGCGIVIMNETGCGIIPLEKSEREWREMTGRAGCIIAERSETVYRVCCGIPTVIKGEKV